MKEVIVNVSDKESMVSVIENNKLVEVYIEPKDDVSIVGNVYVGKVENVLPGMQAAFVDIGLEKNAYLFVEDVVTKAELSESKIKGRAPRIEDYLKSGQTIMVQLKKAPSENKGARVTMDITLPGRYIVVMPLNDYIGISRKIESAEERERLKEIAESLIKNGCGIVVRTVAEGKSEKQLSRDYEKLYEVWEEIEHLWEAKRGKPGLLRGDMDFILRTFRDVIKMDTDRIVVDSQETYQLLKNYIEEFIPTLLGKIHFEDNLSLYDMHEMLRQTLKRKVWMDCGAYLIIDKVEALSVIDVNTGKFIGKKDLEDTAYMVNMAAAEEVARQIRLRNMAGIIVVDFIDMKEEKHRYNLIKKLEEEVKRDSMKVQVMGMTSLGLVEMTRKKAKRSLSTLLEKTCPLCQGKGRILAEENLLKVINRKLAEAERFITADKVRLRVHRKMFEFLSGSGIEYLREMESRYNKEIFVIIDEDFAYDDISVDAF